MKSRDLSQGFFSEAATKNQWRGGGGTSTSKALAIFVLTRTFKKSQTCSTVTPFEDKKNERGIRLW